jgi:hypothetical protein
MRCFIVGGRERAWGQTRGVEIVGQAVVRAVASLSLLRVGSVRADAVEADAVAAVVVMSPSAVHSARKAVTIVVHSVMTRFSVMAPHFRVGRFAYFPHDVYGGREVVDRRSRRGVVPMNTTRMDARGHKTGGEAKKGE